MLGGGLPLHADMRALAWSPERRSAGLARVGVASGVYIFEEPLQREAQRQARERERGRDPRSQAPPADAPARQPKP